MARMTIAQMREREVYRLAARVHEEPTPEDIATARRLMNSFYRLCGLSERVCMLENNDRTCNLPSTSRLEEKRGRWAARLDTDFNAEYNLHIQYLGIFPSIVSIHEHGGVREEVSRFFYD